MTAIQTTGKSTTIVVGNYTDLEKKKSHAADPIVDTDIIADVSEYFIAKGKYRNNLLFILGCNCGLRVGEILSLTWGQLILPDGSVKERVRFIEEKTSKKDKETGSLVKIKEREVVINSAVCEAIYLYMDSKERISLDDYVFKSEARSAAFYSKRRAKGVGLKHDHLSRQYVDKMLKDTIKDAMGYVDMNVSTHTMRKTFARAVWDNAPESQKSDVARFLQKMLGHASLDSTLHYIGVTREEMDDTFLRLNLGQRKESKIINFPNNNSVMSKCEVEE